MTDNFGDFSQQGPGPLGDIQGQVASVLNGNGNNPNVYIPGGPGEPVFQVPNVRALLSSVMRLFGGRG
jgi:hypothetical protein